MSKIIISDTTTLIVLEKQQRLSLLCQLFEQVIIPDTVYKELLAETQNNRALQEICCIRVEQVESSSQLHTLLGILDKGEAEAIELALTKKLPLIIDEKKGRKVAQRLGLTITGLAGLLILSVKNGLFNSSQAQEILDNAVFSGYRLSPALFKEVIKTLSEM